MARLPRESRERYLINSDRITKESPGVNLHYGKELCEGLLEVEFRLDVERRADAQECLWLKTSA